MAQPKVPALASIALQNIVRLWRTPAGALGELPHA